MKIVLCIICFMTLCFSVSPALTADKVVVIPLLGGGGGDASSCTAPDEVWSQGQCWKDRNLGATRVATSSTDSDAYGDLYQWGRLGDGHQNRTSSSTATNSVNDVPGHSDFITMGSSPWDWRVPQNDNLWQGLGGVNNPCPQGFRLPTEEELITEMQSWGSRDAAGAFASPLKLVLAGLCNTEGIVEQEGIAGYYLSSSVSGIYARSLRMGSDFAGIDDDLRVFGFSIRCLKDL